MNQTHARSRRSFVKSIALGTVISSTSWAQDHARQRRGVQPFPPSAEAQSDEVFPQGIASGDPRPDGFLLWTRVPQPSANIEFQIGDSPSFDRIVRDGVAEVSSTSDYTIRIRTEGLEPNRHYWYRFRAGGVSSSVGRTKTAPHPNDDVPVRIAFASCQDYVGRWFHAWRILADRAEDIDFVLFLGDYIYEYEQYPGLQEPQPGRTVKLPDGLVIDAATGVVAARTLADYRELYRLVRADKDLQRIHRLCPFAILWDDHEHANDAWGDHAVDFNGKRGDEKDTARREAATRAWFEHLPVDVTYDAEKRFPNDIVTWRQLRWGQHLDVFLTDERYYRDDHLIAEGPLNPKAGKILPFSPLGSRTMCIKSVFDERESKVQPTMLGEPQRTWLTSSAKESSATWKVWASALMVAPFVLDLRDESGIPPAFQHVFYFKTDQWDGFSSERQKILSDLEDVRNLVILSGDLHGFYAAELHPQFEPGASPTAVEFTVAGISSISLQEQVEAITASQPLLAKSGLAQLAAKLDDNLCRTSKHFIHANSRAYGIGIARFDAESLEVEYLSVDGVRKPTWEGTPGSLRFRVAAGKSRIVRISS